MPTPSSPLLAAEQAAWDAFGAAIDVEQAAEAVVSAAGLDRLPRVLTGTLTIIVAEDGRTLDQGEWKREPVYAHTREAVEAAFSGRDDAIALDIEGVRRARITGERRRTLADALAEFDADERMLETAPETIRHGAAEDRRCEAGERHDEALLAVLTATPTTAAGLLAMLEVFEAREATSVFSDVDEPIAGVFAAIRSFVGRL